MVGSLVGSRIQEASGGLVRDLLLMGASYGSTSLASTSPRTSAVSHTTVRFLQINFDLTIDDGKNYREAKSSGEVDF
jgi:hypothetical protein